MIQQQQLMISEQMNQTRKQIDMFNQSNNLRDKEKDYFKEELVGSEAFVNDWKKNVFHYKDVSEGLENDISELKSNSELLNRKIKKSEELK